MALVLNYFHLSGFQSSLPENYFLPRRASRQAGRTEGHRAGARPTFLLPNFLNFNHTGLLKISPTVNISETKYTIMGYKNRDKMSKAFERAG